MADTATDSSAMSVGMPVGTPVGGTPVGSTCSGMAETGTAIGTATVQLAAAADQLDPSCLAALWLCFERKELGRKLKRSEVEEAALLPCCQPRGRSQHVQLRPRGRRYSERARVWHAPWFCDSIYRCRVSTNCLDVVTDTVNVGFLLAE
jgi:hypothetical protein